MEEESSVTGAERTAPWATLDSPGITEATQQDQTAPGEPIDFDTDVTLTLDSLEAAIEAHEDETEDGDQPYPLSYLTTEDFFGNSQQKDHFHNHQQQQQRGHPFHRHRHHQHQDNESLSEDDEIDRHYLSMIKNTEIYTGAVQNDSSPIWMNTASTLIEMQQQSP